jgi:hypothetical protein
MKNGTTRRGKQNYKCRDCGRQFVENPQWKPIDPHRRAMIDRLLLEKLPLVGIARVMEVSEDWLQGYVNACYAAVSQQVQVKPKTQGQLAVQMDELWSRVDDIVISNKNETLSCTISANNLIKRCGRMRIHYSSL